MKEIQINLEDLNLDNLTNTIQNSETLASKVLVKLARELKQNREEAQKLQYRLSVLKDREISILKGSYLISTNILDKELPLTVITNNDVLVITRDNLELIENYIKD